MPGTSLVIEESRSYCLAGLRYSLFAYLAFICLYPSIRWLKCFSDLNLYGVVTSSDFGAQLKLKFLLMKPTHDDLFKAKKFYIQLSFERYKAKFMLRNSSLSVYVKHWLVQHLPKNMTAVI